jgi:S1-C subfamily serine protease
LTKNFKGIKTMRKMLINLQILLLFTIICPNLSAQDLREVYNKVNPSVVIIHTIDSVVPSGKLQQSTSMKGVGSGVLIPDAKVITAAHVVHTADSAIVEFLNGKRVTCKVIASSPAADVALLQLEEIPENAVVARLADSDKVAIGDNVFIIGAPYGIGHTLTVGHISARHKQNTIMGGFDSGEFFQTDAAINQGNSGGPMFNMHGEVIGIVSSILSKSGGFEGLGFAATSNTASKLLLEEPTPWTGVQGYLLTGKFARIFNLPQSAGLLLQRVAIGSPVYKAGLRGGSIKAVINEKSIVLGGDIILSVDGIQVAGKESRVEIRKRLREISKGEQVTVSVLSAGKVLDLSVYFPD